MAKESTRRAVGEVVGGLSYYAGRLLAAEVEKAKTQATERAKETAKGGAYLGGAALLASVSLGALASIPLLALRRFLPSWVLALGIAGASGAGSVALARRGLDGIEWAAPRFVEKWLRRARGQSTRETGDAGDSRQPDAASGRTPLTE